MDVSVVVPCYRSEDTLPVLVEGLDRVLSAVADRFEVLLVVDGSPDRTWDVAHDLALANPHVRAVRLMRNFGQHNALLAGLHRTTYSVVVTMDDDLQHPPDQIVPLLDRLRDPDVDLVYGVPTEEEHGALRSLASRSVKAALAAGGVANARSVSSFRAFRGELRQALHDVADAFVSLDVLLSWTTTAVVAQPVRMEHRSVGRSGYTLKSLFRHAANMITGYSELPLRLVTYLGLACGTLGVLLLGVALVGYFSGTTDVAGFTSLACMVALFSGAQMVSIGILGEYVGRLHFRSMHRPTYLVREDTNVVSSSLAEQPSVAEQH